MNTASRPTIDRILLPGAMIIAALAHSMALGNFLVGDSWVFVYPRSFAQTLGYFFTSIIPPDGEAYWLRPLPMFTFWLENILLPGTSWLPHLTNILLHVLNVCLLWQVTRFMLSPKGKGETGALAAFTACLVYGIHPLTVGSVDWVAARFDVASITFGLAGILAWMKWDAGVGGKRSLWWGTALLTGSLLSKEQGVTFFMAAFGLTFLRAIAPGKERRIRWEGFAIPAVIGMAYFFYRLIIFGGIGGYVTARNGVSIMPPVNYFIALFFPWPNLIDGWSFSWSFWAASALVLVAGWLLRTAPAKPAGPVRREYLLTALALLALSLATTSPNPGLTLDKVVGHAESRFALIPVTAIALLAGLAASWIRTARAYRIALALVLVWGVAAAWRTTVQVQAWKAAGKVAHRIITETMQLVPDPNPNSTLILLDIPRNTGQYAYIFGIGLDYALMSAYGRNDVRILRYPEREDLNHANPDRDAVVSFVEKTGHMERLRGTRTKRQPPSPQTNQPPALPRDAQ
jgi:hypothetical protein